MAQSKIERISSIEEQIRQLEVQKKQLIQKQKEDERKARTKRLIERGAILESLIPEAVTLTNEQIKTLLEKTVTNDFGRRMLVNLTGEVGEKGMGKASSTAQGNTDPGPQSDGKITRQEG